MPNRTRDEPWERQKGESAQAYEAFVTYRDMGPDRSLRAVGQKLGKSRQLIERWSSAWNWPERVRAYENYLDEAEHKKNRELRKKKKAQNLGISSNLKAKAIEALLMLPAEALTPKDIALFLDKAISIEKDSLEDDSSPSADINLTVKQSPTEPDLSHLSDEDLHALAAMKEDDT